MKVLYALLYLVSTACMANDTFIENQRTDNFVTLAKISPAIPDDSIWF